MNARLLVVDDEEPILFALREYFSARGLEVDCVQELEEAEALFDARDYDVVIADLRLTNIHGAEGLELLSFVRQRSNASVILLTAYGTKEIEERALARGANAFLHKPTSLATLAELVNKLVADGGCCSATARSAS